MLLSNRFVSACVYMNIVALLSCRATHSNIADKMISARQLAGFFYLSTLQSTKCVSSPPSRLTYS